MNRLKRILPHAAIIISLMMLTFYTIDRFNTAMAFINHRMSKDLLAIFSVLVIFVSAMLIGRQQKE